MTKQTEKTAPAKAVVDDTEKLPAAETAAVNGDIAPSGQSLTLEQIHASGLDPAVYGYAADA